MCSLVRTVSKKTLNKNTADVGWLGGFWFIFNGKGVSAEFEILGGGQNKKNQQQPKKKVTQITSSLPLLKMVHHLQLFQWHSQWISKTHYF